MYVVQNSEGYVYIGVTSGLIQNLKQIRMGRRSDTIKTDNISSFRYMHVQPCNGFVKASKYKRWLHEHKFEKRPHNITRWLYFRFLKFFINSIPHTSLEQKTIEAKTSFK